MSIVAVLVLRAARRVARAAGPRATVTPRRAARAWPAALAVEAGDAALAGRRGGASGRVAAGTKSTATDLVTELRPGRRGARSSPGCAAARPDDGIVGEEGTDRSGTSGISWFVDPIDGTTNFVYDLPLLVDVGRRRRRRRHARRRGLPARARRAVRGDPRRRGHAQRSRRSAAATATTSPSRSSPPASPTTPSAGASRRAIVHDLIGHVRDIRRLGSAAIDLCFVAAGRYDAYFETGLQPLGRRRRRADRPRGRVPQRRPPRRTAGTRRAARRHAGHLRRSAGPPRPPRRADRACPMRRLTRRIRHHGARGNPNPGRRGRRADPRGGQAGARGRGLDGAGRRHRARRPSSCSTARCPTSC